MSESQPESAVLASITEDDVEWLMRWGGDRQDEMVFEKGPALAALLAHEVVFLNAFWWEKECPERIQKAIAVACICNDVFAVLGSKLKTASLRLSPNFHHVREPQLNRA